MSGAQRASVYLNALPADQAEAALRRCCGARRWVAAMLAARPFADAAALEAAANAAFAQLTPDDWRQAFAHHPPIGARRFDAARATGTADWSRGEQAGAAVASASVREELAAGNAAYERRFGHVFLICASGLSAEAMLAALRARLDNDPAEELEVAAAEQVKITRLRLEKLGEP